MARDEKDLQGWIYPIRAVAGVESFRQTNVNYIAVDLIEASVNEVNCIGQTPLHVAIKTYKTGLSSAESS